MSTVNTIINYTGNLSSSSTTKTTRVPLATRQTFPDTNNNNTALLQSLNNSIQHYKVHSQRKNYNNNQQIEQQTRSQQQPKLSSRLQAELYSQQSKLRNEQILCQKIKLPKKPDPVIEQLHFGNAQEDPDKCQLQQEKLCSIKGDKYSLRPRSLRRENEVKSSKPTKSKTAKQKSKPAPLSKYRRKTANARERSRMREINVAFETLRHAVPHLFAAQVQCTSGNSSNEKLTKITTLRLAMRYITALSDALHQNDDQLVIPSNSSPEIGDFNDLDCLLLESDCESVPLSDGSISLSDQSFLTSPESLLASPDYSDPTLSPVDFNNPTLPSLFSTDIDNPSHCAELYDPTNSFTTMELSDFF